MALVGRLILNNGVSGIWNPSKYCGISCTNLEPFGRSHTVFNYENLPTNLWHTESYIELCMIFSKIFVLCLMVSYHINYIITKSHLLSEFTTYYLCFIPGHTIG